MRISDLSPAVTKWRDGQTLRAGKWHAEDEQRTYFHRDVYHYSTRMVSYISRDGQAWELDDVRLGWGSVSDQGGVNSLVSDWGAYYSRKGGAEVRFAS